MSLTTAIDDLLAHVPAADGLHPWSEEWHDRFNCLDQKVRVEAYLLGLEGKLPREDRGNVSFWGQTKMPVLGKHDFADGKMFLATGLRAWRNTLLALRALAEAQSRARLPPNKAKVSPENVPAELRELGQRDGKVLTATYLGMTSRWDISSVELTKAYQAGELSYRLKVGNAYAYLYKELIRLLEKRSNRKDEA